jgi:transposase-like protein
LVTNTLAKLGASGYNSAIRGTYLVEVFIKIKGVLYYLWRAVGQDGCEEVSFKVVWAVVKKKYEKQDDIRVKK